VNDAELAQLRRAIKGEPVSEFIRRVVFRYLTRRRK
jgi:hypothetical protein